MARLLRGTAFSSDPGLHAGARLRPTLARRNIRSRAMRGLLCVYEHMQSGSTGLWILQALAFGGKLMGNAVSTEQADGLPRDARDRTGAA